MRLIERKDLPTPRNVRTVLVRIALAVLAGLLGYVVLHLPDDALGLRQEVLAQVPRSGASNPVTSILLNFRSYDTLLEVGVLVLALLGVLAVRATQFHPRRYPTQQPAGPVLIGLVRVLTPFIVLAGGYLLWIGTSAPGGAFQAGAVLAAVLVLLLISEVPLLGTLPPWMRRTLVTLGLGVFLAIGVGVMLGGRNWLEYPVEQAGGLILSIEAASTLSIALILALMFGEIARTSIYRPSEQFEEDTP